MIEEPVKYITKVEIQGLFGRYDIVWNLNKDVNVLAGINGSGKSTVLWHIYALCFFDNEFYLDHDIVENIKITLNGRGIVKETVEDFQHLIPYHRSNIEIRKYVSGRFIKTFDSEARTLEYIRKTDNRAKSDLDFELSELQKEYTKYQVRIYKYGSEINRATHIRFLAMINALFSETNKRVNPDKEELEFLLGDKEINAYQLSSGEKQLLVILLTVLVQDNKPSILLMDEPEISLHFEWQENLINYIRELNPNAQLIIATHSADIIMKGWGDKVFELSKLTMKDRLAS